MPKILVIDDEKAIRNALRDILLFEKYEVEEAADGAEGLKKAEAGGFDLVLCDIKMPKMDGMEVLSKLHEIDADLPIVMISGHGTIEMAVGAIQQGAYDFIEKPFQSDRLLLIVRRALEAASLAQIGRAHV